MKAIVHTSTPNIEKSKDFYSAIGFKAFDANGKQYYNADGMTIELNSDRFARPGIKIIKPSWLKEKQRLNDVCQFWKKSEDVTVYGLGSTWLYLEEGEVFESNEKVDSILGNNSGISIETAELKWVNKVLNILGFKMTYGDLDSSWISMESETGFQISLMAPNSCPHMFFNPSLNYFNGANNLNIINEIKNSGVEIAEEITYFNKKDEVDNIIIRDPGGLGFFIFND